MNTIVEHTITLYLSGNLSDTECADLENLMANSEEMRATYHELKTIWELTNQLSYDQDAAQASWRSFEKELDTEKSGEKRYSWMKIAASIALIGFASAAMWFFGSTNVTFTSNDSVKNIKMYDLSTVILNENSTLELLSDQDDDRREVRLKGQAYFKVAKGEKPFIIHTSQGDITVLGTEFDAMSTAAITTVELYEGKVSYTTEDDEIILKPNMRLVHTAVEKPSMHTIINPVSWNESISCENMPLSYILEQLRLAYSVQVGVNGRVLKDTYTVHLPKDNIKACLQILNDVVGKKFALINGSIVML